MKKLVYNADGSIGYYNDDWSVIADPVDFSNPPVGLDLNRLYPCEIIDDGNGNQIEVALEIYVFRNVGNSVVVGGAA